LITLRIGNIPNKVRRSARKKNLIETIQKIREKAREDMMNERHPTSNASIPFIEEGTIPTNSR